MKSVFLFYIIIFCGINNYLFSAELDSSFSIKWHNDSWGAGGLFPAGPPWNMVGPYDFDNDGFGDFIVASSYAGQYCNGVYHYEATTNDSIDIQWVYTFYDLNCDYDAYSSVAVGDLDGDNNKEIISLVDTSPGISGQKGLQVFEWSPDSMSFLSQPSYTWDMGLDSVWEAAQIFVEDLDGDSKDEVIVSIMDGPWEQLGLGGSSRLMIFELDTVINDTTFNEDGTVQTTNDSALFIIEYEDNSWTNWSGYNISTGDLDNDGLTEIYTVAFDFYHVIVLENTAVNEYEYQTDFYVSSEAYEYGNQSLIVTDINGDAINELFVATSGTKSGETPLTPGRLYVAGNIEDVSFLTFSDFNYFASYEGGLRQIISGDADNDGNSNLYLAGHYDESLYDWEYSGENPLDISSYTERVIFMDDTTDDGGFGLDQGKVRVAKIFVGDLDNDEIGDLIFTSASFAADKPHVYFLEHNGVLGVSSDNKFVPEQIFISQNYPNPFNPKTKFRYTINKPEIVSLKIYDIVGNLVYVVFDEFKMPGVFEEGWDGINQSNQIVSSGIYFYNLQTNSKSITKKMILNK